MTLHLRAQAASANQAVYKRIVGTGGIGSGMFFLLEGNRTLGRNETRMAELVPFRDYCKLHIILHYISVLTGTGAGGTMEVVPIGQVGRDEAGERLLREMAEAGMDTQHVAVSEEAATLFAVCFQYPDSTGGNLTTLNSASGKVSTEQIDAYFRKAAKFDSHEKGIVLAVPEVPLETRIRLLEQGRAAGYFTAASLLPAETAEFAARGGIELTDLLALNIDEAAALAAIEPDCREAATGSESVAIRATANVATPAAAIDAAPAAEASVGGDEATAAAGQFSAFGEATAAAQFSAFGEATAAAAAQFSAFGDATATAAADSEAIALACLRLLRRRNPRIAVCITDGPRGAFGCAADGRLERVPLLPAAAVATGGAGDAFLAGTLAGLSCGLPLTKGRDDTRFGETPLASAMELGTLLASLSVTSPHTIHPTANADLLGSYAAANKLTFSPAFAALFRTVPSQPN